MPAPPGVGFKKYTTMNISKLKRRFRRVHGDAFVGVVLILLILFPFDLFEAFSQSRNAVRARRPRTDSVVSDTLRGPQAESVPDSAEAFLDAEIVVTADSVPYGLDGKRYFNPDPTRAVWMSALFPGLGQIYNRRYWKLPIIVAGFMGLGYGTSWNNGMYQDYSRAYRDILDSDPSTNSYMNFFPPTTEESSLDKDWLSRTMKSRKDYYRRNRDLCIICVVALYLLCLVDAYVDASMAHFDISPNLSMDVAPTMMPAPLGRRPDFGLQWALTF